LPDTSESPETARPPRSPWVRTFWIVLAIVVGLIVVSVLVLQTLGPD
jgi:hypothetical protein